MHNALLPLPVAAPGRVYPAPAPKPLEHHFLATYPNVEGGYCEVVANAQTAEATTLGCPRPCSKRPGSCALAEADAELACNAVGPHPAPRD